MYKLIAIDLDGTMLNQYGVVTANTKEAIQRAQENGIEVVEMGGVEPNPKLSFVKEAIKIAREENVEIFHVPGTFELTFAASKLQKTGKYASIVVIGCVIQGDTPHYDYVCQGVTQGITQVNLEAECPVIFSVLTTLTMQQATDRAGGCLGNKGVEGAVTALKYLL